MLDALHATGEIRRRVVDLLGELLFVSDPALGAELERRWMDG